ncbi:MAG TPA: HNH endonuclease signature motif containing protein, partial [Nakamurella sp.]
HHLRHWVDGGATDLANLALVCRRHHRLVHAGWELAHRPDGIWSATPPWAVPASRTDRDAALSRGP